MSLLISCVASHRHAEIYRNQQKSGNLSPAYTRLAPQSKFTFNRRIELINPCKGTTQNPHALILTDDYHLFQWTPDGGVRRGSDLPLLQNTPQIASSSFAPYLEQSTHHPLVSYFSHDKAIKVVDLRQREPKLLFSLHRPVACFAQHTGSDYHLLVGAANQLLLLDTRGSRSALAQRPLPVTHTQMKSYGRATIHNKEDLCFNQSVALAWAAKGSQAFLHTLDLTCDVSARLSGPRAFERASSAILSAVNPNGMNSVALESVSFPVVDVCEDVTLAGAELVFDRSAAVTKGKGKRGIGTDRDEKVEEDTHIYLFQQSSIGDIYAQELYIRSDIECSPRNTVREKSLNVRINDKPSVQSQLPCGIVARAPYIRPRRENSKNIAKSMLSDPDEYRALALQHTSQQHYPLMSESMHPLVPMPDLQAADVFHVHSRMLQLPRMKSGRTKRRRSQEMRATLQNKTEVEVPESEGGFAAFIVENSKRAIFQAFDAMRFKVKPAHMSSIESFSGANKPRNSLAKLTLWELWSTILDCCIDAGIETPKLGVQSLRNALLEMDMDGTVLSEELLSAPIKDHPTLTSDGLYIRNKGVSHNCLCCERLVDSCNKDSIEICGIPTCIAPHLLAYSLKSNIGGKEEQHSLINITTEAGICPEYEFTESDVTPKLVEILQSTWPSRESRGTVK